MFQGYFKTLRMGIKTLRLLVVEHGVVVITADSQSKSSQIESYG